MAPQWAHAVLSSLCPAKWPSPAAVSAAVLLLTPLLLMLLALSSLLSLAAISSSSSTITSSSGGGGMRFFIPCYIARRGMPDDGKGVEMQSQQQDNREQQGQQQEDDQQQQIQGKEEAGEEEQQQGEEKDDDSPRPRQHIVINFAHKCCREAQPNSCAAALRHGAHRCIAYNMSVLDSAFRTRNARILRQPRGAGYWLWKPYIVLKTLLYEMREGDVLLYSDSGAEAVADLTPLFQLPEQRGSDVVLFGHPDEWGFVERKWTKADAFSLLGVPVREVGERSQAYAAFSVWRRGFVAVQFASQWLAHMQDERVATDRPSDVGGAGAARASELAAGFVEHRHDQSCLGLLAARWRLELADLRLVTQRINHTRDTL